jgi:VIT1/CCC1 family predicted Fe2+/Mn2+ transporter
VKSTSPLGEPARITGRYPTAPDGDLQLEHSHAPAEIAQRLAEPVATSYLKDAIYGGVDGAVTTFAVVSGVAGAGLAPSIVIVLGVANLVGDGFSMAAGNYLGTRAENQRVDQLREIEKKHIRQCPDGEREEIRQILAGLGLQGQVLEQGVETITADETRWIDTMLHNEYNVSSQPTSAWVAAVITFLSFMVVGSLPLAPFVLLWMLGSPLSRGSPFWLSVLLTGVAFFTIGAIKSRFVQQRWLTSGLETLAVGSVAAILAFLCGYALSGLV